MPRTGSRNGPNLLQQARLDLEATRHQLAEAKMLTADLMAQVDSANAAAVRMAGSGRIHPSWIVPEPPRHQTEIRGIKFPLVPVVNKVSPK